MAQASSRPRRRGRWWLKLYPDSAVAGVILIVAPASWIATTVESFSIYIDAYIKPFACDVKSPGPVVVKIRSPGRLACPMVHNIYPNATLIKVNRSRAYRDFVDLLVTSFLNPFKQSISFHPRDAVSVVESGPNLTAPSAYTRRIVWAGT